MTINIILKRLVFSLIFILIIKVVNAQWTPVSNNISFDITDISFKSVSQGALVCNSGLYITSNAGVTWTKQNSYASISDSLAFARTKLTTIYYYGTLNQNYYFGGRDTVNNCAIIFKCGSYTNIISLVISDNSSTCINDINHGLAVGNNGYIAKMTYSGVTKKNTGFSNNLYAVALKHSYGSNSRYVVGNNMIYEYNFVYSSSILDTINSFEYFDLLNGSNKSYYGINNNNNLYVHNMSSGWTYCTSYNGVLNTNAVGNFNHPGYSSLSGLIGTNSGIYRSRDNGEVWEKYPNTDTYIITCFSANIGSSVYAGCKNGIILKNTNITTSITKPYANFSTPGGTCINQPTIFINSGANSNSYIWKVNGVQEATTHDFNKTFTSTGNYTVTLIASSGTYTDTISKIITITSIPITSFAYTISDTLICKEGSADILFNNSENLINYRLIKLSDNSIVDQQISTGGSITLNTGFITDSTQFIIEAVNNQSLCLSIFPDTVTIGVENTSAKFHIGSINDDIGNDVNIYNNSNYFDTIHWDFYNGASIAQSNNTNTVNVSYQSSGTKTVRMIATSSTSCSDTVINSDLHIYSADSNYTRQWAQNFTGTYTPQWTGAAYDIASETEVDEHGKIYYSGILLRSKVPSKHGVIFDTLRTDKELFVAKYDANGALIWVITSKTGGTNGNIIVKDMKISTNNEIFVNVSFYGSSQYPNYLYSNNGDSLLVPSIGANIIKIDTNGVIQWVKNIPISYPRMSVDTQGNLYFASKLGIKKYDNNLNLLWANSFSGLSSYQSLLKDLATDYAGNIYAVMDWRNSSVTFNTTSGNSITLTRSGTGKDLLFVKYNTNGVVQWALSNFSNTRFDNVSRIVVDSAGTSYISGMVENYPNNQAAIFSSVSASSVSYNITGYYLCSYNTDGNLQWAVGSNNAPEVSRLALNKDSSIYVVGEGINLSNTTFTSTDTNSISVNSISSRLIFLKYNTSGELKWLTTESGKEGLNINNNILRLEALDIDVDNNNDMYFTGSTRNFINAVFDDIILCNDTLRPTARNAYVAKMCNNGFEVKDIEIDVDTVYCQGESFSIPFQVYSRFSLFTGNVFNIELSDQYGMFSNSQIIGSLSSINHIDTIYGLIPNYLQYSNSYRIRVTASKQIIIGGKKIITIKPAPIGGTTDTIMCAGQVTLSVDNAEQYNWTPGYLFSDSTTQTVSFNVQSDITVYAEVSSACATVVDTFNISVLSQLQTMIPKDTIVCAMDSLSLNTSQAYTYNWVPITNIQFLPNNNVLIIPNSDINYYVTSIDTISGCFQIDTFNIVANPLPAVNINQSNINLCQFDSITISANTSANYTWLSNYNILNTNSLSPTIFPNTDTIYVIKVTNPQSLCINYDTVFVNLKPLPNVNITYNGQYLSVASGESLYQWYRNDSLIVGSNSNTHTPDLLTNYKVYVIAQNLCDVTSANFLFTSLDEINDKDFYFTIFPNPAHNNIVLHYNAVIEEEMTISILNSLGKIVAAPIINNAKIGSNELTINLSRLNLSPSVYYIYIKRGYNHAIQKLIIQ